MTADEDRFRCRCDPDNLWKPPHPIPVAVEDCPAHQARRAAQQIHIRHQQIAAAAAAFREVIEENVSVGRYRALALTSIEQAELWAERGIRAT